MKGKIADRTDDRLSALRFAMRSAPPKDRRQGRLSLKAAVQELLPDLIAMRHKGYTDAELAEMMTRGGFEIAAGTLKNYINRGKSRAFAEADVPAGGAAAVPAEPGDAPAGSSHASFNTRSARPAAPPRALPPPPPKPPARRRRDKMPVLGHKLNEEV